MNATAPTTRTRDHAENASSRRVVVPFTASNRLGPRERDFGIGYGKSSGYATGRRYAHESARPLFRCA